MIEDVRLDGGTRLLVEQVPASDVVAVGVWYGRGSRDESPGNEGMTHIVEHQLFKGTASRSAGDIARGIDRLGGAINAFTEKECMAIHAIVPRDGFFAASNIIVDFIDNAQFSPAEFQREQAVIEDEIQSAEDDPEEYATDALFARLWKGHPLANKISGEAADIRRYDRDSAYRYYAEHFRGSPELISVAGGISLDEAVAAFGPSAPNPIGSNGAVPALLRYPPAMADPRIGTYASTSAMQVQVFIACQSNRTIRDRSYYELEVANTAFGDSMASRLFQRVREDKGLCYSVYSAPNLFTDCALWICHGSASPSNSAALLEAMDDEVRRLRDNPLSLEEVETAKAHLRGMTKIASQDMEYRMRRMARQALWGEPIATYEESIERIGAVDADAANRILRSFASGTPILFGVGPRKAARAFGKSASKLLEAYDA